MAFDDETIRITVEGAQAQAQLDALAKEVRELELELKMLNETAGVTNAEVEGTTRRLEEAKDRFKEATKAVREHSEAQGENEDKTKSLADKYVALGLKVFGARQVLMAAGEAMRSVAIATGSYSGATKDAIDQTDNLLQSIASLDLIGASKALGQLAGQTVAWAEWLYEVNTELGNLADKNAAAEFGKILAAQGKLVQGHLSEVSALNLKSEALSREIATQQQSGEVHKFIRDEVEATLKAYERVGEEVPPKLAAQAAALGITSDAQDKAAASAAKLEEIAVKAAEERAKAEQKAADAIIAALEKERIALDAKLVQDEARLAASLAKGSKLDDSTDTTDAQKNLENLRREIEKLEATTGLAPEQVNRLYEMKDAAAKLGREVSDLNKVFTVGNEDFLDQAQAADAASAAWDVYRTRLEQAQNRHEKANAAIEDSGDVLDELGETADDAGESLEDAADAAGELGDEAKKGADKAKEGLAGLKEGAEEAIPLLETIKGLLAEIKQAASEVDL